MSTVSPLIHTWTPGTYILINARSNSVVDLNAADRRSVIGFPLHGGLNQHWEFIPEPGGDGYTIRSIWIDLYMTIEGDARENASIVATDRQAVWDVERTNEGLRISWPNSNFVLELADSIAGPRIVLKRLVPGEVGQRWRFIRCSEPQLQPAEVAGVEAARYQEASAPTNVTDESDGGEEAVVESGWAASDPAMTETVITTESDGFITTTRTTTKTVITTITEVTRTQKPRLER